jgi:hypothetical protein
MVLCKKGRPAARPLFYKLKKPCFYGLSWKLLQNLFSVILNGVKDLELVENTRFFASFRITCMVKMRF